MITEIGKNIKFTGVDSNIGTTNQIKKNEKLSGTVSSVQTDSFEKQGNTKKLSTNAKIGIGAGILTVGGLIATAIFTKGKNIKPANFAEHLDFKPAQTMEEAIAYAKKNLGVEKFDFGNDVEMANWVNEGLTNISNRFKGKANMPKELRWSNADELSRHSDSVLGLCNAENARITFSKGNIDNSITKFKDLVEKTFKPYYENGELMAAFHPGADRKVHGEILDIYDELVKNPSDISRFDAINGRLLISDYCQSLEYFNKNALDILKNKILNNDVATKIMKDNNISINIKDYENLPKEQLNKKVVKIIATIGDSTPITETGTLRGNSKFGILYHEMGHYLHKMNRSLKDEMWGNVSKKAKEEFITDIKKQDIAGKVSSYGKTNPNEFVAECFSALCAGKKLPKDVMDLYKYYKGPELPNM